MNNVINLSIKGAGVLMLCYLFNRIIECCRGKPQVKTAAFIDLELKGTTLTGYTVVSEDTTEGQDLEAPQNPILQHAAGPEQIAAIPSSSNTTSAAQQPSLSIEEQQEAIINAYHLILANKIESAKGKAKIIKELIAQMEHKICSIHLYAKGGLQKIADKAPLDDQTAEALIIEFTNFLKNIKEDIVPNSKSEIQLFLLGLLPNIIRNYYVQDSNVIDELINCLMETFRNTTDRGQAHVIWSLHIHAQFATSWNLETTEKEIQFLISVLNDPKHQARSKRIPIILELIMKANLENLSQYNNSVQEALGTYNNGLKK